MAKRERVIAVPTKQVLVRLPVGMHDELVRLVEENQLWDSLQDFIKDAILREIRRVDPDFKM